MEMGGLMNLNGECGYGLIDNQKKRTKIQETRTKEASTSKKQKSINGRG